jgi:hypothetical protein
VTTKVVIGPLKVKQSDTKTGFSPSPSVLCCQRHSTVSLRSLMYHLEDGQWIR